MQRAKPPLLPLTRDAGGVVKRQLARGQQRRRFAEKRGKFLLRALRGQIILTDGHDGPPRRARERGGNVRPVHRRKAGQADDLIFLRRGEQRAVFRQRLQNLIEQLHGVSFPMT